MNILFSWFMSALVILIAAYILPGVHVDGLMTALVIAIVLGILNLLIKPILFILTLPITLLTLGLFMFVINAFLILLTTKFVPGFQVDGFWWAVLYSVIISVMSAFLKHYDKPSEAYSRGK